MNRWLAPSGVSGLGLTPSKKARMWLDLGAYGSSSLSLATASLGLTYRIQPQLEAVFDMGALSADGSALSSEGEDDAEQTTSITNAILGVNGLFETRPFRLKAGLFVSLPTLLAEDNSGGALIARSSRQAQAINGLQDPFRFQPNSVGVWSHIRIEDDFGRYMTTSLEVSAGVLFQVTDGIDFGDYTYLHVAAGGGVRLTPRLVLGVRLPTSSMRRIDGRSGVVYAHSNETQVSLDPYLAANLETLMLSLRASLPLAGPVPSFYEDQGLWVVRGTVGAHF